MLHIQILESPPHIDPHALQWSGIPAYTLHLVDDIIDQTDIDIIVIRSQIQADAVLLSWYPHLQAICRVGIGIENIDTSYCCEHNIRIINTPGSNADAVADLTLWIMLHLCRHTYLPLQDHTQRFVYMGDELSTKTVGIIWFGHIGRAIYRRLQWFGIQHCLIYDPYIDADTLVSYPGTQLIWDKHILIWQSDILTLHLPLTSETHHWLDQHTLDYAHDHLQIINTARGSIIDEQALYTYLLNHPRAGAGLDVRSEEPIYGPLISQLLTLPNMFLTPHIWAMTTQAYDRMHHFVW